MLKVSCSNKPLSSLLRWHLLTGGSFRPQWLLYTSLQALPISRAPWELEKELSR